MQYQKFFDLNAPLINQNKTKTQTCTNDETDVSHKHFGLIIKNLPLKVNINEIVTYLYKYT